MRASPFVTAAVMLGALFGALLIVALFGGCSAPADQNCDLHFDGWHCTCPDPAYTITDSNPWPCGHPTDGSCRPADDCSGARDCVGDDGTLVEIGSDTLTKTKGTGRTHVPNGEAFGTRDLAPLRAVLKQLAADELERKRHAAIAEAESTLQELKAKPRVIDVVVTTCSDPEELANAIEAAANIPSDGAA